MTEDFDPNSIDPQAFFAEQARLYGEDHREKQTYERFCRACNRVLKTPEGQHLIQGLMRVVQFNSSAFRAEDEYNERAAACRDGARGAVQEILVGSHLAEKNHNPNDDD